MSQARLRNEPTNKGPRVVSLFGNPHIEDSRTTVPRNRCRPCWRVLIAPVVFVLTCTLGLFVVSSMSAVADERESGDSEENPVQFREQYSDRPFTAQTTSGYARLRQSRPRDLEATRFVRPPVRTPIDRPSSSRNYNRTPVVRDLDDLDPTPDLREFPDGDPFESPEDSERESLEEGSPTRSRPPVRSFSRPLDGSQRESKDQSLGLSQEDGEPTQRELSSPVFRPTRRIPKGNSATSFGDSESAPESPSLVADDGGPVAEILLHYSATSEAELGAIFHDLFEQLGQNVRLQVCCPNEQSAEAFTNRWGAAAIGEGRSVHVINVNRPITVWARDRRICRQSADGRDASCFVPTAHATYDPEKQNDLVLPSLLWSTGLVPNVALTSMHLEGGNVVSNRRHVFVGINAFEDNEHRFESEEALFTELSQLFGRPAIAIQGLDNRVPWIHTDMYLTPIDTKTILVASPALGCDLLPHRKTITAINRGKPVSVDFDAIDLNSHRQQRFDDVAKQLTDLGYQVIRMPALINVEKDWMVTYNNVIMDYQNGQRVVYMPVYDIPELDQIAAQTYRALGFEVKPINVSTIFQLGGAIRCLANVTRRLPYEARRQENEPETTGRLQVYSVDPSANRAREIRPRRERRPAPISTRERPEQLSTRDYGSSGPTVFGQPSRNSVSRAFPQRDQSDSDTSLRERPGFDRSGFSGRQPVDSGF